MRKILFTLLLMLLVAIGSCTAAKAADDILFPLDRDLYVQSDTMQVGDADTAGVLKLSDGSANALTQAVGAMSSDYTATWPSAPPSFTQMVTMGSAGAITCTPNAYQLLFNGSTFTTLAGTTLTDTNLAATGDGSATIAANYLTAGRIVRIQGGGTITTDGDTGETLRLRLKLGGTGGTVTIDTGNLDVGTVAQLAAPYIYDISFTTRTTGAGGTFAWSGTITYQLTGAATSVTLPFTGAGAVDTTATKLVALCGLFVGTDAADSTVQTFELITSADYS